MLPPLDAEQDEAAAHGSGADCQSERYACACLRQMRCPALRMKVLAFPSSRLLRDAIPALFLHAVANLKAMGSAVQCMWLHARTELHCQRPTHIGRFPSSKAYRWEHLMHDIRHVCKDQAQVLTLASSKLFAACCTSLNRCAAYSDLFLHTVSISQTHLKIHAS